MKFKKVIALVSVVVMLLTLSACSDEMLKKIFGIVMDGLGFKPIALTVENIDLVKTEEAFIGAELKIAKLKGDEIKLPETCKMPIPISLMTALPEVEGEIKNLPIEKLLKMQIALVVEYEKDEDASQMAIYVKEQLEAINNENAKEILGQFGIDESLSSTILLFKDYINFQTIGNIFVVYSSPAAELIKPN
ncbi:MAG: hypothetical protein RR307_01115 [Clostridia bacterium]